MTLLAFAAAADPAAAIITISCPQQQTRHSGMQRSTDGRTL